MSDDNTPTHGLGNFDHETPDSERAALTTDSVDPVTNDEGSEVARR